jgi:DNA gyrase/topoisomerase IV subunit B
LLCKKVRIENEIKMAIFFKFTKNNNSIKSVWENIFGSFGQMDAWPKNQGFNFVSFCRDILKMNVGTHVNDSNDSLLKELNSILKGTLMNPHEKSEQTKSLNHNIEMSEDQEDQETYYDRLIAEEEQKKLRL